MQNNQQEKLRLKIATARSKLQGFFPQDPRGDIKIIIGTKVFKLQKAFLRLQSTYFKKIFNPEQSLLNIDQKFKEDIFQNVLKCFYGITIEIKRCQVTAYYPVIKFLGIQCLLKYLRQDMVKNIAFYDMFMLMKLGHSYSEQEIFVACLNELQKQNFQQLNYSKFQLLKSSEQLFKLIIKTHNRSKCQSTIKGLSYIDIDQLIKQFCQEKGFTESHYHQMKFQLIDKTALSSVEYKQIFLDEVKNVGKKSFIGSNSFIKTQPNSLVFGGQGSLSSMIKASNLTQSMISPASNLNLNQKPSSLVSNQLTLQMQNTFQKKLNNQLRLQNQGLKKQLQILREASQENKSNNQQLKNFLNSLQDSLKIKDDQERKQKELLCRMEKTVIIMKAHLDQKTQAIKKLEQKIFKLQKNINKKYVVDSDSQEQQHTIQSQIVPAHLIGQMMPNPHNKNDQPPAAFKKKPAPSQVVKQAAKIQSQEQLDDQDLEQMYAPRLAFDNEPISIPKKYLPLLADFMTEQGWNKKKLTNVFRRSKEHSSIGNASDIKGRKQLLFLIRTQYNQLIGGYITVELDQYVQGEYIQDKGAFIFSLSKKSKFVVSKQQISEAIFLSESHLISFGNDLSIPLQCLSQKSQCNWPSSYNNNNLNVKADWLIGGPSPFYISQIQVYEVEEAEMEMVL